MRKRLRKKLGKKEFAPKPKVIALTKAVFGALDYGSSYQEFTDALKNISSLRISSKQARALIEMLTRVARSPAPHYPKPPKTRLTRA